MTDISSITSSQKTIEQIIADQASTSTASTRNTGELGKDDFLDLLITQLQHQDPMNPSNDTEFVAQIAQFSALEQMQNLNATTSYQTGFSMIGKYVQASVTDDAGNTTEVSGEVTQVRKSGSDIKLVVNDTEVDMDDVSSISDTMEGSTGRKDLKDYAGLINLLATVGLSDSNGLSTSIEGIVSELNNTDDGLMATLDEVTISPTVDKGAFQTDEAYLEAMTGDTVTFSVEDADSGATIEVKGTLRSYEQQTDGTWNVVLDGVEQNVDDITGTKNVNLVTNEQILLSRILQALGTQTETDAQGTSETSDATETTDAAAAE